MGFGKCQLNVWVLALSVISVVLDKCLNPATANFTLVIFFLWGTRGLCWPHLTLQSVGWAASQAETRQMLVTLSKWLYLAGVCPPGVLQVREADCSSDFKTPWVFFTPLEGGCCGYQVSGSMVVGSRSWFFCSPQVQSFPTLGQFSVDETCLGSPLHKWPPYALT